MKTKTKKLMILLVIGLLFPLILNYNFNFSNNNKPNIDNLKTSSTYVNIWIIDTWKINTSNIGNWTWARTQPWCTKGNGTESNPYVIENVTFLPTAATSGLTIQHSRKYFTVMNCTFKDDAQLGVAGLRLDNVTNAQIVDNRAYKNIYGIHLYDSHDNKIMGNTVYNNTQYGIYVQGEPFIRGCYNNTISGNFANNNTQHGIALIYSCDYNNITGNTANDNGASGILLDGQDGGTAYKNIISGNTANDNTQDGIHLRWECYNNTLSGNTVNNNTLSGIYCINYCVNNTISGNTAKGNDDGIKLDKNCDYNNIKGNTVSDNEYSGINLYDGCDQNEIINNTTNNNNWGIFLNWGALKCTNNKIINNTANNNLEKGIYIHICDYNNITGNIVNDNKYDGIFVESSSHFNNIINNTARRNGDAGISIYNAAHDNTLTNNIAIENIKYGIEVYHSDNSKIINNTVNHNGDIGIYLHFANADYNNITGNTINDNHNIGIYIYDRCDNNNIKNNSINRNNLGIGLQENSNDNTISENILIDNGMCIFEIGCVGNVIENNTCSGSFKGLPIFINGTATGVGAHNWTWAESQPWCSGSGTESQPYIIENISRDGLTMTNGIEIINSNVDFEIRNCTFYNSDIAGIKLENVSNGTLTKNDCFFNFIGINLGSGCDFNNITGNVATNNDNFGISFDLDCDFNILIGNSAINNTNHGIFLEDLCDNNTISHNIALYNGGTGIYLSGGGHGPGSSYNNTFLANTAENNDYGIQFEGDCHFNVIFGNIIKNNNFGIKFDSSCSNNTVYNNLFLKNGKHAFDDGDDNNWNSTTIGNLWDNWTGPDDNPIDGIVDIAYNISGSAGSKDYLPIADDNPPVVIINSPDDDDLFGTNAPTYDVIITDDYLDERWYTLDGGLHNHTFTGFTGTIEQSAWDAMSDGTITLTFYASDLVGNVGFADVSIEKDATGPVIIINSPSSGSEFGANAPDFIITVIDNHLDSVWYSLDGGVNNFTITLNATIDHTTWASLPEGSITIIFYANDTLGNLSFEEITITKNIPSGGIDPTIIIVIVVVSIVGGVAVITGVYIFMKKRAVPE